MAAAQQIVKYGENEPLYSIFNNQAYLAIGKDAKGGYELTIRDGNKICKGESDEVIATFRDNKWLYKGEGFVVAYTVRDNASYIAICEGEGYDNAYTIRDNNSYWAISKGDSTTPVFTIKGDKPQLIEVLALLIAANVINVE